MHKPIIKIVYGTAGGNTKLVCEKVAEILTGRSNEVQLFNVKNLEPESVGSCDLLIFASPTHGHGEIEKYMGLFLRKMGKTDMENWKCAIIGLGDPKYDADYHLESIRIIIQFLKSKNTEILGMPLRISKSPMLWLDSFVPMWAEKIDKLLKEKLEQK